MKHLKYIALLMVVGSLTSPFVQAQDSDENVIDYDSIVKELSSTSSRYQAPSEFYSDPLSQVKFHGGMSYITSYAIVDPEYGSKLNGVLKGVEFTFGIDLLSRFWIAEGAVRSFQPEDLNKNTQISLREFDLRLVHTNNISNNMRYRLGGGLSSRYMTFKSRVPSEIVKDRYTTPSSLIFLGAQIDLSDKVSIGPDVAYRSSLVDDTVDKKSFDANIKLNAHF